MERSTQSRPAGKDDSSGGDERRGHTRVGEHEGKARTPRADAITRELSRDQRALLGDLFAVIGEHSADAADREEIERAFAFACESHADQVRKSGEDFINHPLGVARICAGMRRCERATGRRAASATIDTSRKTMRLIAVPAPAALVTAATSAPAANGARKNPMVAISPTASTTAAINQSTQASISDGI